MTKPISFKRDKRAIYCRSEIHQLCRNKRCPCRCHLNERTVEPNAGLLAAMRAGGADRGEG